MNGLTYDSFAESEHDDSDTKSDSMSRKDWFLLGITHALLVGHVELDKAVAEARKIVEQLME